MKNIIIALCLLTIGTGAFAHIVTADDLETEQTYSETMQTKNQNVKDNVNSKKDEQYQRRIKFSGKNSGPSQSGSYYNFGNGNNWGYRGKF